MMTRPHRRELPNSFFSCVCAVREQDPPTGYPLQTSKTARRDGPRPNHRRGRFRFRYRTTTTVYFQLGSKKCSVLPNRKHGSSEVLA